MFEKITTTGHTQDNPSIRQPEVMALIRQQTAIWRTCSMTRLLSVMSCQCELCRANVVTILDELEDQGVVHTEALGGYITLHELKN